MGLCEHRLSVCISSTNYIIQYTYKNEQVNLCYINSKFYIAFAASVLQFYNVHWCVKEVAYFLCKLNKPTFSS